MFNLELIDHALRGYADLAVASHRDRATTDVCGNAIAEFAKLRKAIEGCTTVTLGADGFGCRRVGAVEAHVTSASVYLVEAPLSFAHSRVLLVKADE